MKEKETVFEVACDNAGKSYYHRYYTAKETLEQWERLKADPANSDIRFFLNDEPVLYWEIYNIYRDNV